MALVAWVLAVALAACAGLTLGAALVRRVERVAVHRIADDATFAQALEDPVLMFVSLAAVSCVAAVAFTPWILPVCLVASGIVVKRAPGYRERRRRELVREECDANLAMLCDITAMGIDAGLSFDAAVELYCSRFDNELSRRLLASRESWARGLAARSDALARLADEVGSAAVRRFSDTAARAVSRGAPLAGMLRNLAVELRQSRKTEIERKVAKAPVKMLVPTGVCILPAMLLVVMGPMLLQFMES